MSENTLEVDAVALMAQAFTRADPAISASDAFLLAAELLKGFQGLAHVFKQWSDAPDTECPNYLVVPFNVVEDGEDTGRVEVIMRRVRPGSVAADVLFKAAKEPT